MNWRFENFRVPDGTCWIVHKKSLLSFVIAYFFFYFYHLFFF